MRDEILAFVQGNYSEGVQELMHDAFEMFEEFELPDYQETYMGFVMISDNSDVNTIRESFFSQVETDLNVILKNHGIELSEDVPIGAVIEIVRALDVLQDYEDKTTIVNYATLDIPTEEIFCELLTLVTPYDTDYFMPFVHEVNQSLIDKLVENNREGAEAEDDDENEFAQLDKMIAKLKRMHATPMFANSLAYQLILQDVPLGADFKVYADKVSDDLLKMTNEQIACNIVALLMMSRDGFLKPQLTFQAWSDSHFEDITKLANVNALINKVLQILDKSELGATNV